MLKLYMQLQQIREGDEFNDSVTDVNPVELSWRFASDKHLVIEVMEAVAQLLSTLQKERDTR